MAETQKRRQHVSPIQDSHGAVAGRRAGLIRTMSVLSVVAMTALVFTSASASANTTRPFLNDIALPGGVGGVQVAGTDPSGNLLVWLDDQHYLAKYDTDGNPVDFSALGTNVLDGRGTNDCPGTPSDCDQVPTDGFRGENGTGLWTGDYIGGQPGPAGTVAAVDSSGGPANGYIYIENNDRSEHPQVDVFNNAGVFLGAIDQSRTRPLPNRAKSYGIVVSTNGTVFVSKWSHSSGFFPIDGNPAHDQFAGQFTFKCSDTACLGTEWYYGTSAATANQFYTYGNYYTHNSTWVKIPISESHHRRTDDPPIPINDTPGDLVFGNGGLSSCNCGVTYRMITIDRSNNHVFLGVSSPDFGDIQEWTEDNKRVGSPFGVGHIGGGALMMAMDRTGGPNDGRLYVPGPTGRTISVFGNPIPTPDITNESATGVHTTAHVSAEVGLAGGPQVDSCKIEYGFDSFYGYTKNCSPATPYTTHAPVSVDLTGLTVEQTYHYRFLVANANGSVVGEDHTFKTSSVLGVTTEPAINITRTGADLNGSLNPDGIAPTRYHFEYGIDTNYTETTPIETAAPGNTVQQVPPVTIGGLQSGRSYHYRLVASNELGVTNGPDMVLVVAAEPSLVSITASNITATSADVEARINDYDSAATYHFEYGRSLEYGSSTPVGNLAASDQEQAITAHLSNLEPGVSYHFRLIATSGWGTKTSSDSSIDFLPPDCPNSHVRQLTNANYLPDCRAYELVSPEAAGNVSLFPGGVTEGLGVGFFQGNPVFALSPPNALGMDMSPSRFAFIGGEGSITGLHPPNDLADRYVATRTNTGWVTTYPGRQGDSTTMVVHPQCDIPMDKCIDYRPSEPLALFENPSEQLPGSNAPYVWDISGKSLGRWPTNLGTVPNGEKFIGDSLPSPDFTHFFFSSRDQSFAQGGTVGTPGSAYDNDTGKATVTVISKLPNGNPIPQEPINAGDETEFIKFRGVSLDGSHILMSPPSEPECPDYRYCPPAEPIHLYLRVDDAVTYDVSRGHLVRFIGMTRDGHRVLFSTPDQLMPEDGDNSVDIYMWSESPEGLTVVTQGNGKGNTDGCNAVWTTACDVKPITPDRPLLDNTFAPGNGDVYFYSPEQLDASNPGVPNQRNLFVYRNGQAQYVTTFDPETEVDRMQIAPDDTHMALVTRSKLTHYDNEGWEEMYTWDPDSGSIQCASCIPSGEPPTLSHVDPCFQCVTKTKDIDASESGPFMSSDGRVAFSTTDALVLGDTNRTIDVYEFTGVRPQLISSGTGDRVRQGGQLFFPGLNTGFEGITASGTDLYFSTFDSLVPQDRNGNFVKFYDARTGGGFPATPPPLPCSAADECHGDSSPPATPAAVGTGGDLGGGGNVQPASGKPHHAKRHRKRRKATHVKTHGRRHHG